MSSFCVEYDVVESEERLELSFCFVVDGHVVGREDVREDLSLTLARLETLLRHRDDRRDNRWMVMPLGRLFQTLEVGTFVYADAGVDAGCDWKTFIRFVAVPRESAAFAGYSAFLVESADQARYVWRAPGEQQPREAWLAPGQVDTALARFRAELRARLDMRLNSPKSGTRPRQRLRDVG